jgi:Alpha/beta hydrolase domain
MATGPAGVPSVVNENTNRHYCCIERGERGSMPNSAIVVEGPIIAGSKGHPFGSAAADLERFGYVEAEYFLSGEALTYEGEGACGADGRWAIREADRVPFRTRILVRRPEDPGRFNGVVNLAWSNVSGGFEVISNPDDRFYEAGGVFIAVSAQAVGVHGYRVDPNGLQAWDPGRYASLSIPTDDASYDILTKVARLARRTIDVQGPDPFEGLDVRWVLAEGASQSAARLQTYINAVQQVELVIDGFLLAVHGGQVCPLASDRTVGRPRDVTDQSANVDQSGLPSIAGLREGADARVFVVNSESETLSFLPVRRPDDARYHYWEIAGRAHTGDIFANLESNGSSDVQFQISLEGSPNFLPWQPVAAAAAVHLERWIVDGTTPPSVAPISVAGDPPTIQRDEHGNALGGVRLPDVEVPTATVTGFGDGGGLMELLGSRLPFSRGKLHTLYETHDRYVAQVKRAATQAVDAGVILQGDAEGMIALAEQAAVPG